VLVSTFLEPDSFGAEDGGGNVLISTFLEPDFFGAEDGGYGSSNRTVLVTIVFTGLFL
jgi:hypothetical protein